MSYTYLPRPDVDRTAQDVDDIYALAAEELQHADSPAARRAAFRHALLRAYEAGTDAQRELIASYTHDRPTPVPPAPVHDPDDPGTLPVERGSSATPGPFKVTHPNEPKPRRS